MLEQMRQEKHLAEQSLQAVEQAMYDKADLLKKEVDARKAMAEIVMRSEANEKAYIRKLEAKHEAIIDSIHEKHEQEKKSSLQFHQAAIKELERCMLDDAGTSIFALKSENASLQNQVHRLNERINRAREIEVQTQRKRAMTNCGVDGWVLPSFISGDSSNRAGYQWSR